MSTAYFSKSYFPPAYYSSYWQNVMQLIWRGLALLGVGS